MEQKLIEKRRGFNTPHFSAPFFNPENSRRVFVIVISGTPGVGKSALARKLARRLEFKHLDPSRHYREIAFRYNQQKQCYDIDLQKFQKLVEEKLKRAKKGLIVDTHIAHYLPARMVDLCIVLTCSDLKRLQRRLQKRGYSQKKIRENLQAEIFQVCLEEARERGHKLIVIDAVKPISTSFLLLKIRKSL